MASHTEIPKKEFKDRCSFHTYKGSGVKYNAIYFDWQDNKEGLGYKYAVAMEIKDGTKAELFNEFYKWVCECVCLPWYIRYKFAVEDKQRFKVGINLNF
jgi:hypothetical protein